MALVVVKANFDGFIAGFELAQRQLPFAIARTLTFCAQDGQAAARAEETSGVFQLRNDWTVRNTKIQAATKQSLTSQVFTDTENRKTHAPDYLPRQEEGGERIPVNGRKYIAIPTKYLRAMTGNGPIPTELRPLAMKQYAENQGRRVVKDGKLRTPSALVRGMYFFLVTLKTGDKAILARALHDKDAYPMYLLVTHANIRKLLHLYEDVDAAVNAALATNWEKAIAEIRLNEQLRQFGLNAKF